jgi:hypothetical protein
MAKRTNIDLLIGQKFNRLTLINEVEPHITTGGNIHRKCEFKCDCGKIIKTQFSPVKNGIYKSCGCHSKDLASKRMKTLNTKHGMFYTPEYNIYSSMKKRCLNKNHKFFMHYGGRGISVCKSWINSFDNFINDMGLRPSKNHSLDRIDNNQGYCKENCRWATKTKQARNVRTNRIIEFNDEKKCLSEWAEIIGVSWHNLYYKLFIAKNYDLGELLKNKKYGSI